MTSLPYTLSSQIGRRAALGLIALQTDETIEPELLDILPRKEVATYVSRIPSSAEVTPETLTQMETHLPQAAGLLPTPVDFDVVGYGCTSGATLIGPDRVGDLIRGATGATHVTNPISAVIAACRELGISRLGFISPYIAEVSAPMRETLNTAGIGIAAFASFNEAEEAKVARIAPSSIRAAIGEISSQAECDGFFVSCTNLHALPIIAAAEADTGRPVISSNQALAWHMMRLADLSETPSGLGELLQKPLDRGA